MDALLETNDVRELDTTQWDITQLVSAAQDGDRQAQGELVRRYEASVYALAMRKLRNHAEAQELCQEVFVKALEKLHQLRVPEALGGWLRSITARMAINRLVRRGPMVTADPLSLETTRANVDTPLERVLAHERRDQVRDGLDRLRELDRQTLVAFYMNGMSLSEMSDEHSAPVGTIKRRLHVARKRLAKELQTMAAL